MPTTMDCHLRLATLMLVFTTSGAFGQKRACDLIPDYAKHEAELHRKYLENIQVRMEEKGYDNGNRNGKLLWTSTHTLLFGKGKMRSHTMMRHSSEKDDIIKGSLYNEGELCDVSLKNGKYVINSQLFDSQRIQAVEDGLMYTSTYLPLTMNGWMRLRAVDRLNDQMRQQGRVPMYQIESFQETTFHGKNVFVLTSKGQNPMSKNYYDPSNNYALLGFESGPIYFQGEMNIVGEITYEPSDLGYPVPKKYVMNYKSPEGIVTPGLEINFLEWKRYTPAADDFDLEKQFGLKPLPRPVEESIETTAPNQVSPQDAGANKWIWVAGFALVPLSVVMVVFFSGRNGRRVTP